jgi:hypothetical protein
MAREYVGGRPNEALGVIMLELVREFTRRIALTEMRAEGVDFHQSIQQGRGLNSDEVATMFVLGGDFI